MQYVSTLLGRGLKVLIAGGVELTPKSIDPDSMSVGNVLSWPLVEAVTLSKVGKSANGKYPPMDGEIEKNIKLLFELIEQRSQ